MFTVFVCVLVAVCMALANAKKLRPREAPIVMAFKNQESTNSRNPNANIEYHCLNNERNYVRGTYGLRGYFEGKVVGQQAFVNFWELTISGDSDLNNVITPSSGSAVIQYSDKWDSVDGPFWSSGNSNITGSYGMWGATEGFCAKCVKGAEKNLREFRHDNCLWNDRSGAMRNRFDYYNGYTLGVQNKSYNVWASAGAGNEQSASLYGAYSYTYSPKECRDNNLDCMMYGYEEAGNYGVNTVSAYVASGRVLATEINIKSGPLAARSPMRTTGTGIYMAYDLPTINNQYGYPDQNVGLVGYFCTTAKEGDKNVLIDCGLDGGERIMNDDRSAPSSSIALVSNGFRGDWNTYEQAGQLFFASQKVYEAITMSSVCMGSGMNKAPEAFTAKAPAAITAAVAAPVAKAADVVVAK